MPEAEADFRKAISVDPKNLDAYAALARFYAFTGQADKAIEVLQQGIKANPDAAGQLSPAGVAVHRIGRKNDAETVLQNLRNTKPSSGDLAGEIAGFYLGGAQPGSCHSANTIAAFRSIPRTTS